MADLSSFETSKRIGIATVLSNIVSIAGSSIGPLLLGIFNSLLKLLQASLVLQGSANCLNTDSEKLFQEKLIMAVRDFTTALPDFQKVGGHS